MKLAKNQYSPNRLSALSDGIFAIAMTILVLNISIPGKEIVTEIGLCKALLAQSQEFLVYFLSFFLLGIFWSIQHKQINTITKTDPLHIWLNIILLMFVCLIPFSASLLSSYNSNPTSAIVFNSNLLIIAILILCSLFYATKNHRLVREDLNRASIAESKMNVFVFIAVSLLALIVGVFLPEYSGYTFFLIPVLKAMVKKRNILIA